MEVLREITVSINQQTLKEGGEGSVLYVTGVTQDKKEETALICKVKTIEYRIYRKLREKLKIYIRKFNKHYDHLLKQYKKEVEEIAREFQIQQLLQHYFDTAEKAFQLCGEQTRPVSRFVHNRFIDFLRLVQQGVTKEAFMKIAEDKAAMLPEPTEEDEDQEEKHKEKGQEGRE